MVETLKTLSPRSRVTYDDLMDYFRSGDALADDRVNLRIPAIFTGIPINEYSMTPEATMPSPERLYPAGVKLPGYNRTCEADLQDSEGNKATVSMYLAAKPAPEGTIDEEADRLREELSERVTGKIDPWEDVEIETPDGGILQWQRLRVEGSFEFDLYQSDGQGGRQKHAGVIELFYYEGQGFHVIIGYKCVAELEEESKLAELVPLSAGTLKFTDAPAAGADDIAAVNDGLTNGGLVNPLPVADEKDLMLPEDLGNPDVDYPPIAWERFADGLPCVFGYRKGIAESQQTGIPAMLCFIKLDDQLSRRHISQNLKRPEIRPIIARDVLLVFVSGDLEPDVTRALQVSTYPYTLVVDSRGRKLGFAAGLPSLKQFQPWLEGLLKDR